MFRKIAVIGPGQIGTGIAQVAAATGHVVVLNGQSDADLKKSKSTMERNLKQDQNIRRMKAADQKTKIAEILRYLLCFFLSSVSYNYTVAYHV